MSQTKAQLLDGKNATIQYTAGSASAPAISFTGDTNTGIYSPGADQVAISTNGTGRLFVDSSGRVGVGTTSVNTTLEVLNSSTPIIRVGDGTRHVELRGGSTSQNAAIGTNYAGSFDIIQNGSAAVTIDASKRVGIGTASPGHPLQVGAGFAVNGGVVYWGEALTGNNRGLLSWGTNLATVEAPQSIALFTNSSERARIDSSGRLLVGTSASASAANSQYARLQVHGNTFSSTNQWGALSLARTTSATSIVANDPIGGILFTDSSGNEFATIITRADANAGSGDYPGRIEFSTCADGASSPTERMRITNGGTVLIGNTTVFSLLSNTATGSAFGSDGTQVTYASAQTAAYFGRQANDGTIVEFRQDGSAEGSISVSGTTVSYNGAHLSRWSQLPSGAERVEILRGTVLSNIDKMCEWGDEDNEQLNRMKVSDVEGDKNVSGVFQAWDDDDDTYTNDFYCAMTGDFIIRIGAGVTVERGDLLMSAGDGTAKPQDDDIIRSKTIAKVTSTNVTCTYDDGSYCVPCVLMAC